MKSISLFLLSFIALTIVAQPSLTSNDVGAVLGDVFNPQGIEYVDPGVSGASVVWDFSTLTATGDNQVISAVDPSGFSNTSMFPSVNVVYDQEGTGQTYYEISASGTSHHAFDVDGVLISYSDPEIVYAYPFQFNVDWIDPWAASFVNGGVQFDRAGTTTGTVDGYGTLITPNATHDNVLRVKLIQDYTDEYEVNGTPFVSNYYTVIYAWFKAGIHYPLMSLSSIDTDFGSSFFGSLSDASITSVPDLEVQYEKLDLRPNPASEHVILGFDSPISSDIIVSCHNILSGAVMSGLRYEDMGAGEIRINTDDFSSGTYLLTVIQSGIIRSELLVIE